SRRGPDLLRAHGPEAALRGEDELALKPLRRIAGVEHHERAIRGERHHARNASSRLVDRGDEIPAWGVAEILAALDPRDVLGAQERRAHDHGMRFTPGTPARCRLP